MKILTIHADFIEFAAKKKAFKAAEEGIEKEKQRIEECLVVFTAVEKEDTLEIVPRYVQEIKNISQQVNAQRIVLYPYAHLSSNLSSPDVALKVMQEAEKILKEKYQVTRAPFGWYKFFNVSCKGHPLSELSRQFSVKKEEKKLVREFKDEPFTFNQKELTKAEKIKLTAAYLTGLAITKLYPSANPGSVNFYHDQAYVDIANAKIKQDDFQRISKQFNSLKESLSIEKTDLDQVSNFQKEIANDLKEKAVAYKFDDLVVVPLFTEPFLKEINCFKLLNSSSAYWKNNENNQQLTRINLVAFSSQEELAKYEKQQEEAEARSHLRIGKEQNLFVVSDLVGAGLPLLTPKGTIIRKEIVKFLWELHQGKGYGQVTIPHVAKDLLYKKSGHWDKFGDELFHVKGRYEDLVLKPMNCPHHIQIYDHSSYSYRDLPVRFFEPTTVYRDEKPGQLLGLSRVRSITQDDGHVFCRVDQIKGEVKTVVSIIQKFYQTFAMDKDYWVSLSVRDDDLNKYLGEEKVWDTAEKALEEVAQEQNLPYKKIKGEAAFYGPKLDFIFKDALGREWQLATVQLDFNLPARFELSYINKEGNKEQPAMIHRAISGALERFMSVMIEHFAGKFPLWLNPVQVKVLTITDRNLEFAQKVMQKMVTKGLRVELDARTETMGKKIRDAQTEKVNYIVTIGDKEVTKQCLAVRDRNGQQQFDVNVDTFIEKLVKYVKERTLH